MKATTYIFTTAFLVAGCAPTFSAEVPQDQGPTLTLNAEEVALLAFLNDHELTDSETLIVDCGIRSDTAQEIMNYRNGLDGEAGTWDDNSVDTLVELDEIFGVSRDTIERLTSCANSFGYQPTLPELNMLQLLNDQAYTDLDLLDIHCGLHADAARNLIAHRDGPDGKPGTADDNLYHSLEEVDAVPQMGIWNVNRLMSCPIRLSDSRPANSL